jgi:hypothetical protein
LEAKQRKEVKKQETKDEEEQATGKEEQLLEG